MLHVVEAVVDEELEFGDDAQLFADTCAKLVAHLSLVGVDVLHDFLGPLAGEDAEIDAALAEVWADAADTDADQHASHGTGLPLEDVAQLLLDEPGYFILTGCFHNI